MGSDFVPQARKRRVTSFRVGIRRSGELLRPRSYGIEWVGLLWLTPQWSIGCSVFRCIAGRSVVLGSVGIMTYRVQPDSSTLPRQEGVWSHE